MVGGIFMPIDCDLSSRLGKIRIENKFSKTLHFNEANNQKEFKVMKDFLNAFVESTACFRAIVVNSTTWEKLNRHDARARLVALLLSYPWIFAEDKLYNKLSAARIVLDRQSISSKQQIEFSNELNRILKKKNTVLSEPIANIKDSTITFMPRQAACELQLADTILGVIRTGYLIEDKHVTVENIQKKEMRTELHNSFLGLFPKLKTFIGANRSDTDQKINVWTKAPSVK
jgi:hypothetical protein